jgi:hypothetical protein
MTALGKFAIIDIAKEKDAKKERIVSIKKSTCRVRKALWKTHQKHKGRVNP